MEDKKTISSNELEEKLAEQERVISTKLELEYLKRTKADIEAFKAKQKSTTAAPTLTTYVLVAFTVVILGVGVVVLITIFGPAGSDNAVTIGAIFAFCAAVMLQLFTALQNIEIKVEARESKEELKREALEAKELAKSTYHEINSKMSAALENAHLSGLGEGRALGRQEANARTDKLSGTEHVTAMPSEKATPVKIVGTTDTLPVEIIEGKPPP